MASRTREELCQIIDRGESVFVRDQAGGLRLVSRREDLPSEAELAKASGTAEDVAAAKRALQERARQLLAEADGLDAAPASGPEPPKVQSPAPPADPKDDPKPKGK